MDEKSPGESRALKLCFAVDRRNKAEEGMRDICVSVPQHFASYTAKPTTPSSPMPSNILHHNPQGREGPPAAISFRDGQKTQPQTQSQVLTTFKKRAPAGTSTEMGLLGKKRRIQIQICVLEIADGCLGVGLGLPIKHTARLRSGNFRLTSTSKGASKGV